MSGKTAALLIIGIPLGVIVGGLVLCVVLDLLDGRRIAAARAATCPDPDQADAVLSLRDNVYHLAARAAESPDDGRSA